MKKIVSSETSQRTAAPKARRGFTLIELLVVIAIIAILAAMLLPVLASSKEKAMRIACVSNLKQVAIGVNIYATENNDFVPQRSWPQGQNPWQTYEACRVGADGKTITRGPYNFGLLYFTKAIPDPRVFYCPSLTSSSSSRNYDYYSTQGWPSTPVGSGDDNVRSAYNYYPQPKTRVPVDGPLGSGASAPSLPVLNYQPMTFASPNPGDPVQSSLSSPEPLKMGQMDPTKSVSWDIAQTLTGLNHKSSGRPGGVNVMYGDGHVQFTQVRGNTATAMPFWKGFWQIDPGNDGPGTGDNNSQLFRALADSFQ